jgi:hypothetical protein
MGPCVAGTPRRRGGSSHRAAIERFDTDPVLVTACRSAVRGTDGGLRFRRIIGALGGGARTATAFGLAARSGSAAT